MNKVFIYIFLICFLFFTGCAGCSSSGRKKINLNGNKENGSLKRQQSSDMPASTYQPNQEIEKEVEEKKIVPEFENVESTNSLSELYKTNKPSVFLIYTSNNTESFQGSGFFISEDGLALSNYHVFEGTTKGKEIIQTHDGRQLKIDEVIYKSSDYDFILFKVKNSGKINYLNIASKTLDVGEDVFAIGNPKGLEHTLSTGIISGYRDEYNFIQTTTEITHGSSGGPLLNMRGEVIGITTSGLGEANLNFAINIQKIKLFIPKTLTSSQEEKSNLVKSFVKRVVDGDTFEASTGEKIRLIGVDTPETKHPRKGKEPFGEEAFAYTKELIENKTVWLEFDIEKRDRYGRLLAYVFVDDLFLNEELVLEGLAKVATYPPNVKYVDTFTQAQEIAKSNQKNIWSWN